MKLSVIQKKAAEKAKKIGTYHIPDGIHEGTLISAEYNKQNDRVYLKFKLTDGTIFKCSTDLADYYYEPLSGIIAPFIDEDDEFKFEDITDIDVQIETTTNESSDGKLFSNITDFAYMDDDCESEE